MVPHDMTAERVPMPPGARDSVVLFSGPSTRHLRLGYLIQRRFPGLLKGWWIDAPSRKSALSAKFAKAMGIFSNSQTGAEVRDLVRTGDVARLANIAWRRVRKGDVGRFARLVKVYARRSDYARVEEEMFGAELARLKAAGTIHPTLTESANGDECVAALRAINPYFIVTFGGPLLRGRVLDCARGFAINQHAGWSPLIKGASTTETAIYHRNLGAVGNTVHLMDTHADSGAILRRSTATLHADDTLAHCFVAVCAVGTKLMLETLETALHADSLPVFPQPPGGQTVLNIDFTPAKREAIGRDMANGWLGDALRMAQDF